MYRSFWYLPLILILFFGATSLGFGAEVPEGFPPVVYPEDNTFTADRYELGRKLFYDPILSADSSISCASCHLPELISVIRWH